MANPTMPEAMLGIRGLHSYYGEAHVLDGVSLDVPAGRIVALLGRNGMGKTTLIRSIMGLTPPEVREGSIAATSFPAASARCSPSRAR